MSKNGISSIRQDSDLQLLTLKQACERLAISRATAYLMMNSGELPFIQLRGTRRIPLSAIRAIIEPATR